MLNKSIRQDFPYWKNNKKVVYFDNGATTLKPKSVIKAEAEYLEKIAANPHTNDYESAYEANEIMAMTRRNVADFINANKPEEIIFTAGASASLNQVAFGLRNYLKKGDEILVTTLEHSSNLLPWIVLAKEKGLVIKELPLTQDLKIDISKLKEVITKKTKVISFASISNTVAAKNDIEKITKEIRKINKEIIVSIDIAQSVAHAKTDVKKWDVDFVSFSSHKMYGPFGVGVLYGKFDKLNLLEPVTYGGGMSKEISIKNMSYGLEDLPGRLETGTPNMPGIYGLNAAIKMINEIGIENIETHEQELKMYARKLIKDANLEEKIEFYNLENDSSNILFNVKGINAQDIATFLSNEYKISTRSGSHCVRISKEAIGVKTSIRASLAIYNTTDEIDKFVEALKNTDKFLDYLF